MCVIEVGAITRVLWDRRPLWSLGERVPQLFRCLGAQRRRELHVEDDDEPAFVEGVSVLGKPFVGHHLHGAVRDDRLTGSRAHHNGPLVEGLDRRLEATQRLREREVHLHGEVAAMALKYSVLFLFELNDDITLLLPGVVVALAVEREPVRARHAAINLQLRTKEETRYSRVT